jgi:hypothetical protein
MDVYVSCAASIRGRLVGIKDELYKIPLQCDIL